MRLSLLLLLLLIAPGLFAQTRPACAQVYTSVDKAAEYQYGQGSLTDFINSSLTPVVVGCSGTDFGRVGSLYFNLLIDSLGAVGEVDFISGSLSEACRQQVHARIRAMQGWKPATINGQPVCSRFRWAVGTLGSNVQGLGSLRGVDTLPHMRMAAEPEKPKAIDSNVRLAPYALARHATQLPEAQKKKLVRAAVRATLGNSSGLFLQSPCLALDTAGAEMRLKQRAPDCRLKDFHFIDLDRDGDLDIVYNSVIDQFLNWGTNRLFIFRNEGSDYSLLSIEGYLYDADFSQWEGGSLLLKTVLRPGDGSPKFRFRESRFSSGDWSIKTTPAFERRPGLVKEQMHP